MKIWTRLNRTGLNRTGLNRSGPNRRGVNWTGVNWTGLKADLWRRARRGLSESLPALIISVGIALLLIGGAWAEARSGRARASEAVPALLDDCNPDPTPTPFPDLCSFCYDDSHCICIEYSYDWGGCVQEFCSGGCQCFDTYPPNCQLC